MTWDLVTAREWAVSEKGLIDYCRVEWIRGGGTACSSNSGCADWLPISTFWYIIVQEINVRLFVLTECGQSAGQHDAGHPHGLLHSLHQRLRPRLRVSSLFTLSWDGHGFLQSETK